MYKHHLHIYLASCPAWMPACLKAIPSLPNFSHIFSESALLESRLAACADLIICGADIGPESIESFSGRKKPDSEIIALQHPGWKRCGRELAIVSDIWPLPLSEDELIFRFSHWLEARKRMSDLEEKANFLETVLETSPNLIWFKTKDGVHELVNPSFCRVVNKTRKQVQGRRHAFIWNVEKDDPACIESERIVMESGEAHVSEEKITTGEGERILITYKAPLRDGDGAMMGTMGIAVDVTNERRYREKLIQNNAALEALFTTMDCGILCHSLDGKRVISVNQAALNMLGYTDKESLEADFQMVAATVLDEDKPRLRAAISQLRNVGDSASFEYRVNRRSRETAHIMGNAKLTRKDDEIICQRFLLDCTAQKLAEEKARSERDRRHKELIHALSTDFQLVFVYDPASASITTLQLLDRPDRKLAEIFSSGGSMSDKISGYIEKCVHPEDREACREEFAPDSLQKNIAHSGIHYFNYRALSEAGIHYFQMKAARAGERDGPYSIVIGLQSVDSRIRAEMEQRSVLSDALKEARKASEAKSVFLSNMSHDIRTPMNAVLGYTTLALGHLREPDSVKAYLDKIKDSGGHLISLINDILDMSHIESGKAKLEEDLWNLPGLLGELLNIVQPSAEAKGQRLIFDIQNLADENIYCDKLRLKQALLNLLSNAIKYTGANGNIRLTVCEKPCPMPGRASYEMRLKDNGIGMSAEFLKRIFDPFERAHTAKTANIQGTGLGMAITKNIVSLMQGEISVISEPDVGSEFTLLLNFRIPAEAVQSGKAEEKEEAATARKPARAARILLAEDNEMNQEIASEFLKDAGYEVEIANNGKEAVEMVAAAPPGHYDIILMDVQMPVLNGYMATGQIRGLADKSNASLPIIAMTANSFEEDRLEAMQRGMNGHVPKPIDFKALFKTIDSFLAKDSGQNANAENCAN